LFALFICALSLCQILFSLNSEGRKKVKFILKHKDISVIELELDDGGTISAFGELLNEARLPVGALGKNA